MLLSLCYAVLILIYAIFVMAVLLDVRPGELSASRRVVFFGSFVALPLLSIVLGATVGKKLATFYPIFIHLPTLLVFLYVSGRKLARVFFVLLTAILLIFPLAFSHGLTHKVFRSTVAVTIICDIAVAVLCVWLICRYMAPNFRYAMERFSQREILTFCAVPIGYNILNYVSSGYDYASALTPIRAVVFVSAIGVYLLFINIFKNTLVMEQLRSEKNLMDIQMEAAKQHIDNLRDTQQQTMTYSHDLHHHFALLSGFADGGDMDKLRDYLANAQQRVDSVTPHSYCDNNTANLILSSFASKAERLGVTMSVEAALPSELGISDGELCAVLANSLENAITAAAQVEPSELRRVEVGCIVKNDKLMLGIKNPYTGTVEMKDGLPQATREEHGFGVRSIAAIVDAHNGFYSFKPEDGIFMLRIMLPLDMACQGVTVAGG